MKKWFRMEVKEAEPTVADLFIFGFIGDWVDDLMSDWGFGFDSVQTAKSFQNELDALPESVKTLRLHVNSPGGDVFGAVTIANMLRDQRNSKGRTVEASIEGLAASAASIVVQAGDPIRMADNALVMIHNPWTRALGESKDLRKVADELDTIAGAIIATYKWHSELSNEEIAEMMNETTWMDADDAILFGFATEKVEGLRAAASLDPKSLARLTIPEKYRARVEALLKPEPEASPVPAQCDPKAVVLACKAAGFPDLASDLLEETTIEAVNAKLTEAKDARAAAETRATAIRGLCKTHKAEDRAEEYVRAGVSVEFVKSELTWVTAKIDKVEIDSHLDPDAGRASGTLNVIDVMRKRSRLHAAKGV